MDSIQCRWNRYSFNGTPSFVLAKKLQALKEAIKRSNVREFRYVKGK